MKKIRRKRKKFNLYSLNSGGLDRTVKMIDFKTSEETALGSHEKPVKVFFFLFN